MFCLKAVTGFRDKIILTFLSGSEITLGSYDMEVGH